MKNLITFLVLSIITFSTFGQVGLNRTFDELKKDYPDGMVKETSKGTFIYCTANLSTKSFYFYMFNSNLVCYMTMIKPADKDVKKSWVKALDQDWTIIYNKKISLRKHNKWVLYEKSGDIVYCELLKWGEKKEPIFIFTNKE